MKYNSELQYHRRYLAAEIIDNLMTEGFQRNTKLEGKRPPYSEAVFSKQVQDDVYVVVYTSCDLRGAAWETKKSGKDAIRVATLKIEKDGKRLGLAKQTRTHRTGNVDDIISRLNDRCAAAFKIAMYPTRCEQCNSVKFVSKKGNLVCADFCWTKRPTQQYASSKTTRTFNF
jgi:hypothetical protein